MIASLAMLVIVAGCAAYLFAKGTLAQGITMIFNIISAGFVAFGFFEMLAQYLIKYSPGIAIWAQMICFLLLFILTFAVLQTMTMQFGKEKVDLGKLPEQIGRPLAGVILGYLVTGHLLVAAAMAPLPSQYPYPRFDERNPDASSPAQPLLSPDGFVTGLFATVSKGSFSALSTPRSFAVLHAGFVDQLYLNRHKATDKVPLLTSSIALDAKKDSVRFAPDNLRDSEGKPLTTQAGQTLMLVRAGIRRGALRDASKFTLSQMRLVCTPKTGSPNPLAGTGEAVYPLGYIGPGNRLERKSLADLITMEDPGGPGDAVLMDLAFSVPANLTPVLLEFKRNNIVQLSAPVSGEDAPPPVPFGAAAPSPQAAPQPAPDRQTEPAPSSGDQRQGSGLSDFSRSVVGNGLEEN
jgi:uncharacterized integral membrane protein